MVGGDSLRRPALRPGWYPGAAREVKELLDSWSADLRCLQAKAAVSPHAGWHYSGRMAAKALASLGPCDTIAIVGGHLGPSDPLLCAPETRFQTVGAVIEADTELREALFAELREQGFPPLAQDDEADNSVEVLLPLVAALHPGSKVLWLRCPPRPEAKELGAALGRASAILGIRTACVGSTDLTHYGRAYGFSPMGLGPEAETWVRKVNDKAFVDSLLAMDSEACLATSRKKACSCSAGAAAAAIGFALETGATEARLLEYGTSLDTIRAESFVGYVAIAFC
ncbi:MAG TPA: AmmeMemoRadiSam system protein B [Rectinemataceae bacterium]